MIIFFQENLGNSKLFIPESPESMLNSTLSFISKPENQSLAVGIGSPM
jgi:hypothetical protein